MNDSPRTSDLITLARIALTGRQQDVQLLLRRLAKKHRVSDPRLADQLMALLQESPTRASPLRRQSDVPLPVDGDTRIHLLRIEDNPMLDAEPVYTADVQQTLDQLVKERRKPELLSRAGLEPTRTALFVGPPGVGKTLAARWIARELGKPLLILDLAAVMSSYLGRTGTNLRQVLDYAKSLDCVLLLDELDAIAKRRDDHSEIGELKRLVTVLIQQIDDWPSTGLLLAATNHSDLLDPAIWRRFESIVSFPLPHADARSAYLFSLISEIEPRAAEWSKLLAISLDGSSYSDMERAIANARRHAALSSDPLEDFLGRLIDVERMSKADRIALAEQLIANDILSQRRACELTGVARDTVRSRMQATVKSKPRTRNKRKVA
ncbi:ATP-binding protein [Filomicrobium sp.]|uniref:AAA family ATPase n=1 Tax=Filomicrobium sp. TaxID=2024831 RepID=UPI002588EFD3|nr:ATP-binding protein [Filomicrobium sp.]MCV0370496.1 ATP-binding protein [Filomicrobium sp.]